MKEAGFSYLVKPLLVNLTPAEEARFWEKVNKGGPIPEHMPHLGNCWLWTGGLFKDRKDPTRGYGAFYWRGRNHAASRIAFGIANPGVEIPPGMVIGHDCDTPECVRHVRIFTQRDNLMDMASKGRQKYTAPINPPRGDKHWVRATKEGREHMARIVEASRVARIGKPRLKRTPDGRLVHNAKFVPDDIREIRARYANGEKQTALAAENGVTQTAIQLITSRKNWSHVV